MRDDEQQLKIELLSQWKLEAESRKKMKRQQHRRTTQLSVLTIATRAEKSVGRFSSSFQYFINKLLTIE